MQPSARIQRALWLYLTGACNTKREASAEAGLHPSYLTIAMNTSEPTKQMAASIQEQLNNDAADMSKVMRKLGRMAVGKLAGLLDSGSETIQLKAAIDLADRSPETQKTQRIEVADLTLAGADAKAIAKALVEAAMVNQTYSGAELIEIDTDAQTPVHLIHAAPAGAEEQPDGTAAVESP